MYAAPTSIAMMPSEMIALTFSGAAARDGLDAPVLSVTGLGIVPG